MGEAEKKIADEIIKKRLEEIAGEGDIITQDGVDKTGSGEGKHIEIEEDEESKKIFEKSGLGLNSFDSLSDVNTSSAPEPDDSGIDIVDAVDVEGSDEVADEISPSSKQAEKKVDANKVAYADREKDDESRVVDKTKDIEAELEALGISKDEVIDLIFQLTDDGYIDEHVSLFGGRLRAVFKSPKMIDSAKFIDMMDDEEMNTPAKVEFYINLYSLAAILVKYKDVDLSKKDIRDRVKWIEENIPTVMYKAILPKAMEFHRKIELLSSEEVANFF